MADDAVIVAVVRLTEVCNDVACDEPAEEGGDPPLYAVYDGLVFEVRDAIKGDAVPETMIVRTPDRLVDADRATHSLLSPSHHLLGNRQVGQDFVVFATESAGGGGLFDFTSGDGVAGVTEGRAVVDRGSAPDPADRPLAAIDRVLVAEIASELG